MADDTQRLVVSLEAKIDQFQKALDKATGVADDRMSKIQKRFNGGSDQITRGLSKLGSQSLATNKINERLIAGMSQGAKAASDFGEASAEAGHAIGGISSQSQAAFHSIRSVAEQIALGVPVTQALTGQLNHLTYAASGPGGLKAAFGGVLKIFSGLFTPFRLAAGGLAAIGVAAISSAVSFANSQSKIQLSLEGVGKASGVTVSNINDIASAVSKTGDISESEAANIATAIASTGKVSADVTKQATGLAHAYSLVFDKSLEDSAKDLGAALADPAKGIDTLNGRLGAWNAKQVELVKNLALAGNREAAQKILVDGIKTSIGDAAEKTTIWARAWDAVSASAGNFFNGVGKTINATPLSPQEAFDAAQTKLTALQSGGQGGLGRRGLFGDPQQIAAATAELDKAQDALQDFNDEIEQTNANTKATDLSNLVKGIDPAFQKLNELKATIENIESLPRDQYDQSSLAVLDSVLRSLKNQHNVLSQNLDLSKQRIGVANEQYQIDAKSAALDIAALNARSPQQKAQIAYQQKLNELQNADPTVAHAEAQLAFNKSLATSLHDLSEAQSDRIYQANESVEQQEVENQALGLGVQAATTLTQRFQLLSAARAEAHKNNTVVSPEELAAMDEAARKLGQLAAASAAFNAQNNAKFDISQLGRTQSEQNVYSTLQGAGLLDNGEIVSAQAKQTAEILRTKEALSSLADTEKTFASSFLSDLVQGKSATEALGDALSAVANKLLDSGVDALISGITSSGGNKSLLSLFGFADGGVFVPGKGPQPLKRYAGGGVSNTAAIFGEAGPEAAIPLKGGKVPVDLRMPAAAPASSQTSQINIAIDARNSTPAAVDKLNGTTLPQLEKIIDERIGYNITRKAGVKKAIRRA